MDRVIYTAGGGAARTLEHQAVVSNNLANVSTQGFQAQLAQFRAVPIQGAGLPTRVGVVATTPGIDASPGPLQVTGRALDVAVSRGGWLAVQTPQGEAYTRQGGLLVDVDGLLKTPTGHPVLADNGQPIEVPANARLTIGADGTISVLGAGDLPQGMGELGRLKLVAPDPHQLARGPDGLMRLAVAPGQPAPVLPPDLTLQVVSGALEGSNVNAMQAMVELINNGRRFEMQMQAVQSADRNAERANQLLSAQG
ncbi:MAG: flagellar basal body rod protein FlgF [Pigmentiphaga sp.]